MSSNCLELRQHKRCKLYSSQLEDMKTNSSSHTRHCHDLGDLCQSLRLHMTRVWNLSWDATRRFIIKPHFYELTGAVRLRRIYTKILIYRTNVKWLGFWRVSFSQKLKASLSREQFQLVIGWRIELGTSALQHQYHKNTRRRCIRKFKQLIFLPWLNVDYVLIQDHLSLILIGNTFSSSTRQG